ncbi:hypothetical protein KC340_g14146 [Hortaea werneckii]|nr:hypothetical protein KC342_g14516 [Hortaea werneckii]KAI7096536.1 hypothetical protein KC339_g10318 [Hortaea werneckii]KAI7206658.1 hypothetical protein KC365_g17013 [Hortaea werneckii]KAI7298798.1 hypothetical protein KC340_g14146 [Hortaea werneckii]KAI7385894.1 hypothetical protein KC328_g10111 [Hortaea werneckii]
MSIRRARHSMAAYDQVATSRSSRASSVQPVDPHAHAREHSHLHPRDAISAGSPPPQGPRGSSPLGRSDTVTTATQHESRGKRRDKRRGRSGNRRGKTPWKKLLWVKQNYPDNYTDEETFLDHLQRNPRLRPYEFWPLVADSTIIVQHVCSVVIFVCCFTAIFQERVSPQTVVGWATSGTVAGWVLRDWWQSEEDLEEALAAKGALLDSSMPTEDEEKASTSGTSGSAPASATAEFGMPYKETPSVLNATSTMTSKPHSRNPSTGSTSSNLPSVPLASADTPSRPQTTASSAVPAPAYLPKYPGKPSSFSPRMQERLTTAKSAILIYCSLLGLSPILKSLTKSTSSDSIWAISSWLLILNIFTFDYGAGPEVKFPASLSTNAALMASTVLASRLPSTTHVFSLTLFSIEVFGLFPVFRRHLRHHSWPGHLWLTVALVSMASGGLSITISGGGWGMGVLGILLGSMVTCLSLGLTSWWLIGLQRYKNEIHGPWDPARPIIRRHWD